jgi:hypothetical protein
VFIGAFVRVAYLPNPKHFKLFAAMVLLYIGTRMIRDLLRKPLPGADKASSEKRFQELVRQYRKKEERAKSLKGEALPAVRITHFNFKRLGYEFYGESFDISIWTIFTLSFIVGIVGGVYGIGGGSIIAPFFVSFCGLPVYTVAGAALMGTFVTSIAGVIFYQAIAPFYPDMSIAPDWLLGILFGLGGMCGMYFGARCQKYVPAKVIKWMLGGIQGATSIPAVGKYIRILLSVTRLYIKSCYLNNKSSECLSTIFFTQGLIDDCIILIE